MVNQLVPAMVLSRCIPLGPKALSATFMGITIKLPINPSINPPINPAINLLITLLNNLFILALTPFPQTDWKSVKSDSLVERPSSWACRTGRRQ